MRDAAPVRSVERVRDLTCVLKGLGERQRAALQPSRQRLTFEVLHHEERQPLVLAYVIQRADMRVVDLRDRSGFAVESFAKLAVGRQRLWKDLDRDRPIQPRVSCPIHFAHAAGANGGLNLIGTESGAVGQTHGRGQILARP